MLSVQVIKTGKCIRADLQFTHKKNTICYIFPQELESIQSNILGDW